MEYIGCLVSINCGEILGNYQGQVASVGDGDPQTISLIRAFRNGVPVQVPLITIQARDITDLQILKRSDDVRENVLSVVTALNKPYIDQPSPAVPQTQYPVLSPRHESKDFQSYNHITDYLSSTPTGGGGSKAFQSQGNTPQGKQNKRNKNLHDTFNVNTDEMNDDFDFETNLALFEEMKLSSGTGSHQQPDVVKTSRLHDGIKNVLKQEPTVYRRIAVPAKGKREYVTDTGIIVPSVKKELRQKLLSILARHGLTIERQIELIGSASCEMVIQLLGGGRRLSPQNSHQRPRVLVLSGVHVQGAQGVACARHLANHGVAVTLFTTPNTPLPPYMAGEVYLFQMSTHGRLATASEDFPKTPIDMIVVALDSHVDAEVAQLNTTEWYRTMVRQVLSPTNKMVPILCIDPPSGSLKLTAKWSIAPALPYSYDPSAGSIFLCDLGIPDKVFSEVGITYESPFSAKFVVSLHSN